MAGNRRFKQAQPTGELSNSDHVLHGKQHCNRLMKNFIDMG
jgi:hypothetical protein